MSPHEKTIAIRDKDGRALAFHQSLYPSKDIVDSFERHHVGAAAEILRMCGEEQKHFHKMEDSAVRSEIKCRERGLMFGFILSASSLLGGIALILLDKNAEGWVALISALTFVFIAFIKGSKFK